MIKHVDRFTKLLSDFLVHHERIFPFSSYWLPVIREDLNCEHNREYLLKFNSYIFKKVNTAFILYQIAFCSDGNPFSGRRCSHFRIALLTAIDQLGGVGRCAPIQAWQEVANFIIKCILLTLKGNYIIKSKMETKWDSKMFVLLSRKTIQTVALPP